MRLIDADALTKEKNIYEADLRLMIPLFVVEDAPTIDAVEVVCCKDCKWYEPCTDWGIDEATGRRDHSKIVKKPYGECHGQDFHFTEDGCLRVGDDDFCSYGERKVGDS